MSTDVLLEIVERLGQQTQIAGAIVGALAEIEAGNSRQYVKVSIMPIGSVKQVEAIVDTGSVIACYPREDGLRLLLADGTRVVVVGDGEPERLWEVFEADAMSIDEVYKGMLEMKKEQAAAEDQ